MITIYLKINQIYITLWDAYGFESVIYYRKIWHITELSVF